MAFPRFISRGAVPVLGAIALALVPGPIAGNRMPSPDSPRREVAEPGAPPETTVVVRIPVVAIRPAPDLRRNLFAFDTQPVAARVASAVTREPPQPFVSAEATSPAAEWPSMIGIVEERNGTRTAVLLNSRGETIFVVPGDVVDGEYRVRLIEADSIELVRLQTGEPRVSRLR